MQEASAFLHFGRFFMLTSLSFIFLVGLSVAAIVERLRLPRIVGMACTVKRRCPAAESAGLSVKFGGLWSAAEVLLFVLVGAAVDIRYTLDAGIAAVGMIFIALIFRAAGVLLCLAGTPLDLRERLFCVIAYLPKATVQAAIGSVPLSMGLPCGNIILSVAVLAIIITAPLGAVGIDASCKKLLKRE